jgi:hypothetical protein
MFFIVTFPAQNGAGPFRKRRACALPRILCRHRLSYVQKALCLLLVFRLLSTAEPSAKSLFREGQRREKLGDIPGAYTLYLQAAAADPTNQRYRRHAEALAAHPGLVSQPAAPMGPIRPAVSPADAEPAFAVPQPPVQLQALPVRRSFSLSGDSREIFDIVARAYGLNVVFDSDYPAGRPLRLQTEDVDYRQALHILQTATASFVVPISERLILVVQDTLQKRVQVEQTMTVSIPLPTPVAAQEAVELARAIQQLFEIQRFSVDTAKQIAVIRDRMSKVLPATELFWQLMNHRAQVAIEVELLAVSRSHSRLIGISWPTALPLVNFGRFPWASRSVPQGVSQLLTFGGGRTLFGLGVANADLFARASRTFSTSLMRSEQRTLDGQAATFHVGSRYPIMTTQYLGSAAPGQGAYIPPSNFVFEDLGLVVKVTPKVHDSEEVSLELEAEVKTLAGSSFNLIPVIQQRRFVNRIRLKFGESAVLAGLVSLSEVRAATGPAGAASVPLLGAVFRRSETRRDEGQALVVVRPRLLSLPPSGMSLRAVWTGSEARPRIPL